MEISPTFISLTACDETLLTASVLRQHTKQCCMIDAGENNVSHTLIDEIFKYYCTATVAARDSITKMQNM